MVACIIPTLLGAFFQQEKSSIKRIMQHRLLQEETRVKKQEMQFQSCEGGGGGGCYCNLLSSFLY